MKNNILYRKNNRKGFTLAELLMTVAILLIVFALAVPAVFAIQRNLRQKELDSKAEIIYTAVQDKLTELYSKGKSSEYVPSESKGIYSLGKNADGKDLAPADYVSKNLGTDSDGNPINEEQSFYYFTSESTFAQSFIDDSTLSADLKNGHWVVEYIPYAAKDENSNTTTNKVTSAIVYAVYYSEGDDYNITTLNDSSSAKFSYAKTDHSITDNFLNFYRYKEHRMDKDEADARVGYYGGSTAGSGSETARFEIMTAKINSGDEINTAEVKIKNPYSGMNDFKYTFTFSDGKGHEYQMQYDNGGFTLADGSATLPDEIQKYSIEKPVISGSVYYFVFKLDDLSSEETRFKNLYGTERQHTETEDGTGKNQQLNNGTTLTLDVTASSSDKRLNSDSVSVKGNSLFDYNAEKAIGTQAGIYISNGRHLQNLDESSGCKKTNMANVYLENDIDLGKDSKFAETYAKTDKRSYFNGYTYSVDAGTKTSTMVPDFKSITDNAIYVFTSNGKNNAYTISGLTTTGSGLFESASETDDHKSLKLEISNIRLTGERVLSEGKDTVAGGLIGTVNKNVVLNIQNVQIFLDKEKNDIPATITADTNAESYRWISADTAGGLIGVNNGTVTITESSVSSVIGKNTSTTGGLIGTNKGSVTITESYADNYAYGNKVAGFIGNNEGSASVKTSYTAGFLGVSENGQGAGFVSGNKVTTIDNSYTVVAAYNIASDGGLNEVSDVSAVNFKYFRTGEKVTNTNVYYLKDSKNLSDEDKKDGAAAIGKPEALVNALTGFNTNDKVTVNPYQLLGKSLSNYEYPKLKLNHYGDWTADYVPGALVYYEVYKDADGNYSVGFEGANLEVSLISDKDVIGDGYGVLYKQDTSEKKPNTVSVTFDDANKSLNMNNVLEETNHEVTVNGGNVTLTANVNGVNYDIYRLSNNITDQSNAVSGYYDRVTLTAKDENNSEVSTRYYDFNPHFARTVREVTDINSPASVLSNIISIRSPRHLYNLSRFYDNGYRNLTKEKTYQQERNMVYSNYAWTAFTNEQTAVNKQAPIGTTEQTSFASNYDGGCYRIGDVGFETEAGEYVGMFGYVKGEGKFVPSISNVFLLTQYNSDNAKDSYRVERSKAVERNNTLYAGVLVGKNTGNITNCAVAGYYLSQTGSEGSDGTIYGYENSTLYIGGLVGWNEGSIRNSSADNPKLSLSMFKANCYAGGFVGYNFGSGTINNSYALTSITSDASDGKTVIAGFAGYNTASISNSYCATALTAQGTGTKAYAFGSNEGNGIETASYYLSQGSYRFVDKLYSYGRGEMNGASGTETNTTGSPMTYSELEQRSRLGKAVESSYNGETFKSDSSAKEYPFRAVVKNRENNYVHYGEWTVKPVLGTYGMFYWEHETSGENNGYKFTYVGMVDDSVYTESTLCDAHDDGGIITEYGYGYYVSDDNNLNVLLTSNDIAGMSKESINVAAQKDLETQVPGINFYPYTTSTDNSDSNNNKLWLTSGGQNGSVTLTVSRTDTNSSRTLNYTISPFFANAISLKTTDIIPVNNKEIDLTKADSRFLNTNPSFDTNNYEIRSAQQLQYINWNSGTRSTASLVNTNNYWNYNYLMYASWTGNQSNIRQTYNDLANSEKTKSNLMFKQSHDLNAQNVQDYVPIACPTTSSSNQQGSGYSSILYTWFGSTFDGQSYKIQELSINSKGYAVGLFGVTVGADLKNIIMYSSDTTKKAVIQRQTTPSDAKGAYSLGGLVGVAYDYFTPVNRTITNCSIAGYEIQDNSQNQLTLGEANVGGLIGVSNVNVDRCSAVVDIKENATHPRMKSVTTGGSTQIDPNSITTALYGNFIRVGGLCGAVKNKVTSSYTGGTISVGEGLLDETFANWQNNVGSNRIPYKDSKGNISKDVVKASIPGSSHVYISGIAGSAFTMNYANFSGKNTSDDGTPDVENCYTYVNFPKIEGTIRAISMITNMADRYGATSNKANIYNCYYLENSANLDFSNMPYYYFAKDKDNNKPVIPATLKDTTWGKNALKSMLDGDVRVLLNILSGSQEDTEQKVIKENVSSISYADLSSSEGLTKLNTTSDGLTLTAQWSKVTTKDNKGGNVDGKYSFNAGTSKLEGKNYPFPTIVTQDSTINVHYGEWPTDGPYWSEGNATIDLINDLQSNGKATKTFEIEKADGEKTNSLAGYTKPTLFEYDENYISIDENAVTKTSDNKYLVPVEAKKTGSTTVKAKWINDGNVIEEADFTVTVTCDFTVDLDDANDRTLQLGTATTNKTRTVKLVAKSSNDQVIDTTKNFNWDVSVSQTVIANSNDADAVIGKTGNDHKTDLTVTGHGYDATITVKGIYRYQGNEYESSVRIAVKKLNFIGISNNSNFYETSISNTDTKDPGMMEAVYANENKPDYTDSSYYLYEYRDSNFISNTTANLTLMNGDSEVAGSSVTLGEKVSFGNYNYYPIVLDTSLVDPNAYSDNLQNATIQVRVTTDLNTVTYTLSLNGIYAELPHVIHFTDITGENEIPVATDVIVTESVNKVQISLNNAITHEGYALEGWYADTEDGKVKVLEADGSVVGGNVDGYVTDGKLTLSAHTVTLHPLWRRYVATLADRDSLDENGQYIVYRRPLAGTSYLTPTSGNTSGYLQNVMQLGENAFGFTDVGNMNGTVYSMDDYIFKANELSGKTGDIYQITEEQLYRYVQPDTQSETDESSQVTDEQ